MSSTKSRSKSLHPSDINAQNNDEVANESAQETVVSPKELRRTPRTKSVFSEISTPKVPNIVCPHATCTNPPFQTPRGLQMHLKNKHSVELAENAESQQVSSPAVPTAKTSLGTIICMFPGCENAPFQTRGGLDKHMKKKHNGWKPNVDFQESGEPDAPEQMEVEQEAEEPVQPEETVQAAEEKESEEPEAPITEIPPVVATPSLGTILCMFPGCENAPFQTRGGLDKHMKKKHNGWKPNVDSQNSEEPDAPEQMEVEQEAEEPVQPEETVQAADEKESEEPEAPEQMEVEQAAQPAEEPKEVNCPWKSMGCDHPPFTNDQEPPKNPPQEEKMDENLANLIGSLTKRTSGRTDRKRKMESEKEVQKEKEEKKEENEAVVWKPKEVPPMVDLPMNEEEEEEEEDPTKDPSYVSMVSEKRPDPPQWVFSVGHQCRKLLPKLQKKEHLTKRKLKDEYCLPCLDFKLANGKCSQEHDKDENADRLQKFWLETFPHDPKELTKQMVLDDLKEIGWKWF